MSVCGSYFAHYFNYAYEIILARITEVSLGHMSGTIRSVIDFEPNTIAMVAIEHMIRSLELILSSW